jgi:hypothetical protein
LRFGAARKELFGYDPATTNNRMELMAAIQGLLAFKEPCEVEVTTDSEYVLQGITLWVPAWKRRHWWKKNRPVRNADLWIELDGLAGIHKTTWTWTKGHWLAQNAARTQTSSWPDGRAHAYLRLGLNRDYVPPKPQAGLFENLDSAGYEEDDDGDPD